VTTSSIFSEYEQLGAVTSDECYDRADVGNLNWALQAFDAELRCDDGR